MQKFKRNGDCIATNNVYVVDACIITCIERFTAGLQTRCAEITIDGGAKFIVDARFYRYWSPVAGGYYIIHPSGAANFLPAAIFHHNYTAVDDYPVREETLTTAPPAAAKQARDLATTALRDHMATEVLKSIILSPEFHGPKEALVTLAYKYADLMLLERAK